MKKQSKQLYPTKLLIALTGDQFKKLAAIAKRSQASMAEVVRILITEAK